MATTAKVAKTKKKPKFAVRRKNRCELCGRPRGFVGKFKLCRLCFRQNASRGLLPGVTKASW